MLTRVSEYSDIRGSVAVAGWGMPRYRRERVPGGTFFFTMNLLEGRRRLLVDHVDDLRASFRAARDAQPFEVVAIVILPEHLHCIWRLPEGDADNAGRWARIGDKEGRFISLGNLRSHAYRRRRSSTTTSSTG